MRNRAKCKLCGEIIESLKQHNMVSCSCGQISIDGGTEYFRCLAIDWSNFIRIADDGSEVEIKVKEAEDNKEEKGVDEKIEEKGPSREELMKIFKDHITHSEGLPNHVKTTFVTYMDLDSAMSLIYAILRAKD